MTLQERAQKLVDELTAFPQPLKVWVERIMEAFEQVAEEAKKEGR